MAETFTSICTQNVQFFHTSGESARVSQRMCSEPEDSCTIMQLGSLCEFKLVVQLLILQVTCLLTFRTVPLPKSAIASDRGSSCPSAGLIFLRPNNSSSPSCSLLAVALLSHVRGRIHSKYGPNKLSRNFRYLKQTFWYLAKRYVSGCIIFLS